MTTHGTIHGRFQPFHVAHLHMARLAFRHCDELTVGLTNPDPDRRSRESEEDHRHRRRHNPFTYWERYRIVNRVLLEDGFSARAFSIVPFDINHMENEEWASYMPRDATWFLRVKGEWGEEKLRRLRSHGLEVETLPYDKYTEISGTNLRRGMIEEGWGGSWEDVLPAGGGSVLEEIQAVERLRELYS